MTTAFEFLPKNERKACRPVYSIISLISLSLAFSAGFVTMREWSRRLEKECNLAKIRAEEVKLNFMTRAEKFLPDETAIKQLAESIRRHNLMMDKRNSAWTRLFNVIDSCLPDDSIILAIENPSSNQPLFSSEDRAFRVKVAVSGIEEANTLYMKLAAINSIVALSFNPRGEMIHQGRKCLNVDLEFRFNENNASTS
jgi:hypothetical protein